MKVRILLVDDEREFADTLAERLTARGYETTTMYSGDEALEHTKANDYDVIILDVRMPGKDGLQTLKEIKEDNPDAEIILLTGHADLKTAIKGMKCGASDYLSKPADMPELERAIKQALGHKSEVTRSLWRQALIIGGIVAIFAILVVFPRDAVHIYDKGFDLNLFLFLLFLAFFSEYVSSCVGEGYGLFVTPALIVFGFDPLVIIPAVLLSEFLNAVATTVFHQRLGNVDFDPKKIFFKIALVFSAAGVVGAVTAACIAVSLPVLVLKIFIAFVFVLTGTLILVSGRLHWNLSWGKVFALGLLGSFNKALAGGGFGPVTTGGQIIMAIKPKNAVAVSKFAKGLTCLSGFLAYYFLKDNVLSVNVTLSMLIGATCAAPFSAWTVGGLQAKSLKVIIALVTLMLGIMIIGNLFLTGK